jgi:AcrR family transcriptional regulator
MGLRTLYGTAVVDLVHRTDKPLSWRNAMEEESSPSAGSSAVRRRLRSGVDVDRIVAAAVRLADAEGLPAVSMRRVAADVGVPAMTLYGHVPGKTELVDLMLDAVLGELYPDDRATSTGHWRARLEAVVRANRAFFLRHPWAVPVAGRRPSPGPNLRRKYESELRAVEGLGLSDVQADLLVTLLDGFVRGTVDRPSAADGTPPPRAPGEPYAGQGSEASFEFGLERLLDGIGVLILNPSR